MKICSTTLFILLLCFTGYAQELRYEVQTTDRWSIKEDALKNVKTICDVYPDYPTSWINRYFSVSLTATCNGKTLKAMSADDKFSEEQLTMLRTVDTGTNIKVDVSYNPKNSLNDDTDTKEISFSYKVMPAHEAMYPEGNEAMMKYIKETTMDKIPASFMTELKFVAIRFSVDASGKISNTELTRSSDLENVDVLLLKVINDMPKWKPAQNTAGVKSAQSFEFRVGSNGNCLWSS